MNIYRLVTDNDEVVGTIIELDNGKAVTSWEWEGEPQSVAIWDSIDDAAKIHAGKGHRSLLPIATLYG